jgi:uncharacterized membrane protein YdjX (TVP38/TMEM64 family)
MRTFHFRDCFTILWVPVVFFVCLKFDSHLSFTTTAAAEQGFRIMTMLYLTPIMPLGPISYMCGTTSMALSSFLTAKIASLPLKLLYAVIGGSAVGSAGAIVSNSSEVVAGGGELKDVQENRSLIVSGILFSFVMIAWITHYTKKELNKVRCVVVYVLEPFTISILSLS